MKVEIETQIEVTMKMNLREARTIEYALEVTRYTKTASELYEQIRSALKGQESK